MAAPKPKLKPAPVATALPEMRSEHILISSDDSPTPNAATRTVRERHTLTNPLRRTSVELTLYAEGFLDVVTRRRGAERDRARLDLHYLDPVPTIERSFAARWFYAALGCALAAALALALARFEMLYWAGLGVGAAAVLAAGATLFVGIYRSGERTAFNTIHGRAPVLELVANFGCLRKFRAFVPQLSAAIEEAADNIGDDTAAFLRAEMREHYRLRGDGVLSTQACADSTGRILAQFDVPL